MEAHRNDPAARRPLVEMDEEVARRRVVVEHVSPTVEGGRYPVKRVLDEEVVVEATLVADGHDVVTGLLRFGQDEMVEVLLEEIGQDRFRGTFVADRLGRWRFQVVGWVDHFATWRRGFQKKVAAHQDVEVDLAIGVGFVQGAVARANAADKRALSTVLKSLKDETIPLVDRIHLALDDTLAARMHRNPDRTHGMPSREYEVVVDPVQARFSAWYEFFPRSWGTFGDAEQMLPYIAGLGFDVVYLPPIHPIGRTFRKGPNNRLDAGPDAVGSPWAIGNEDGGHKAVHPRLGTVEDFRRFVGRAEEHGLKVALDIAFQASPDHPWVTEHPAWFKHRPDGTIQYAENPPKKYQDIYPIDFETEDWRALWAELRDVFAFWVAQGVTIFRVDNPHTKSLRFWEWCIADLKAEHPELIFLAEAFTRPTLMHALAKRGFSQGYTYFTWREHRWEFEEYLRQLKETADFYRPNFWPNTPDILPPHLVHGGRAAFQGRLVMAATMASSYGLYGPAYELMEHTPREGVEEYVDNEKYQLREWDLSAPHSLAPLMRRLNAIRKAHPALQDWRNLTIHPTSDDALLCYSKAAGDDVILVVVNLDWHHPREGLLTLDLHALGVRPDRPFVVRDLVLDAQWTWHGQENYVALRPDDFPAHVFHVWSA